MSQYSIIANDGIICETHHEVIDEAIAPTCTETGLTEGKHCFVCDAVIVEQTVVDALEHNYETEDGIEYTCTLCGDTYTVSE